MTGDDYGAVDANLGTTALDPGIAVFYGDTNFNGNVTGDDYAVIDGNLGLGVGNPLFAQAAVSNASVPEPASALMMLGVGMLPLLRRRRRWLCS